MFRGTIVSGNRSKRVIRIKNMPEEFILSVRDVMVLEMEAYEALIEKAYPKDKPSLADNCR